MTSTPQQQYCLRWNNYQNNLTNVFDQLLQSEAFVDVTLSCEGHSLKAHKVVLSACSPYFQSLFFDNPCKHPIVILNGIKWDELKSVVEFMYRGEINVSQEQLAPLLKVAEVLKIRGLADVSRGSPTGPPGSNLSDTTLGSANLHQHLHRNDPDKGVGRNPADFLSTSNHDSGSESPALHTNGHHHNISLHAAAAGASSSSAGGGPAALSPAQAHQMLASLSRRKRRKMSTPERTPSPPEDDMDDHSNQLEIDSTNGDYEHNNSPPLSSANLVNESSAVSMSLNAIPANNNSNSLGGPSNSFGGGRDGSNSASSLGSIGPALMNLHAAAAAAVAVANAANNVGSSNSMDRGSGNPGAPSGSSSVSNDLDIKPGIVEMIREEERAKMLESAHGWLGPANSTLSDSYQYQIQNLWQKCWNQNQTGMMHALRFRERGPLKSWRPETMAEAIFAVLREGLSLSQAARKYDIPYPTFVLYANRVHNMLGPSADGSSNTDLMSDMRPKGRGRPQRILLGTWPEEHIRGVIRAVVFRDTQSTKEEMPFVFNRDGSLCLSQTPGSGTGSHNGLDMSIHPQFLGNNQFIGTPSSSQGASNMTPSPSSSSTPGPSGSNQGGINLININDTGNAAQHLQIQMSHGNSRSSSTSSSPLQQALSSNSLSGIGAQAQSQLLAFQQRHLQQQLQLHQSQRRSSSENSSPLGLLSSKKGSHSGGGSSHLHLSHHGGLGNFGGKDLSKDHHHHHRGGITEDDKEILHIKAELAPFDVDDEEEEGLEDEDLENDEAVGVIHPDHHEDDNNGESDQKESGNSSYATNLVKDLSQCRSSSRASFSSSKSEHQQDLNLVCNNNKSPNSKNNNNNESLGGSNLIDNERQLRSRRGTDDQASAVVQGILVQQQMHEQQRAGDVNTPSPKSAVPSDHQTTTSS